MRTILILSLFLISSAAFAQPPVLDAGCGAGASIVGTSKAGKVTLGDVESLGVDTACVLTFDTAFGKVPSCLAGVEPVDNHAPQPIGTVSSKTDLVIEGKFLANGTVIAYLCVAP